MAKTTAIEWADSTVNFWQGCSKVSPGCAWCYAERLAKQRGQDFGVLRRTSPATFDAALSWKEPKRIFTCSLSDFFHPDADQWRKDAWDVIKRTPQHTWLILTKRIERVAEHLPRGWGMGWENVWLGTSVESYRYGPRIEALLDTPAAIRFLSCEPLVGPLFLGDHFLKRRFAADDPRSFRPGGRGVDWVIAGGESGGPEDRRLVAPCNQATRYLTGDPAHKTCPECNGTGWAPKPGALGTIRSMRDQCQAHGVAFLFKQWGGPQPKSGGRLLDGRTWSEYPRPLNKRVPETPMQRLALPMEIPV